MLINNELNINPNYFFLGLRNSYSNSSAGRERAVDAQNQNLKNKKNWFINVWKELRI